MRRVRAVLVIGAGAGVGAAFGILVMGLGDFRAGVALALAGVLLIAADLMRHVQRRKDKARHPASTIMRVADTAYHVEYVGGKPIRLIHPRDMP